MLVPAHSRLFWFILACSGWLQVITSFTSDTHLESALPSQPKKCKVISCKGQKTLQIVTGSDRDNTTILAAVSASGKTFPPLIIFPGKQVQTTWRPATDANQEFYAWIYLNEKGWMKADIFHKWFVEWEIKSRTENEEGVLETRLMIYNGHLSCVHYVTICYAHEKNVTILTASHHQHIAAMRCPCV